MEMINPDLPVGCLLPRKAYLGSGFFVSKPVGYVLTVKK